MRWCCGEQGGIHLIARHEGGAPVRDLILLTDPPPEMGVDEVCVPHRRDGIVRDRQPAARLRATRLRELAPGRRRLMPGGRGVREPHAHQRADHHQRRAHIRRVADKSDVQVLKTFLKQPVLDHREDVADDLGRMVIVRQPVDDRNHGVSGEIQHSLVLQGPRLDRIDHAAEDGSRVLELPRWPIWVSPGRR